MEALLAEYMAIRMEIMQISLDLAVLEHAEKLSDSARRTGGK